VEDDRETALRLLRAQAQQYAGVLAEGRPQTLEAYREAVGHLKGLRWALELCEKTLLR
jgi:hypothetical protein